MISNIDDLISFLQKYNVVTFEGVNGCGKSFICNDLKLRTLLDDDEENYWNYNVNQYYAWPGRRLNKDYQKMGADITHSAIWILDFLSQQDLSIHDKELIIMDRSIPTVLMNNVVGSTNGIQNQYSTTLTEDQKKECAKYYNQKMMDINGKTILIHSPKLMEDPKYATRYNEYLSMMDRYSIDYVIYVNNY